MLKHLTIYNYVLIATLDIDLQPGFSVVTGETGAGKSIILGALGLLMGQRADSGNIMPGATKCTVEGIFSIEDPDMQALFEENGLDYDPTECILRRELTTAGKSRAFINDTPVSVALLRQAALHLLDIHSQHSNLLLENPAFQLGAIDTVCNHGDLLTSYRDCYARIVQARRQLKESEENLARRKDDEDYLRFQLDQLEEFKPKKGEDEELGLLQTTLSHAEDIRKALSVVSVLLAGGGDDATAAIDALQRSGQTLQQILRFCPEAGECRERLESALIEVNDIAREVERLAENVEYNPVRLEQVTERLDHLFALEQKHHVGSAEELIAVATDIRSKLDSLADSEDNIKALQEQIAADTKLAKNLAERLSAGRKKAAKQVEKLVAEALAEMDMPAAKFSVSIETQTELLPTGEDIVTFLFSSSAKNMPAKPLSEIASGGEMSRVMLALKALIARKTHLPTIIFDEIDTGISGKVASSMAKIMSKMSSEAHQQVLAITHLPQIAAKGDTHYFVYKEDDGERTLTHIRQLDQEGRIAELAHLLSGSTVTEAAMENARQLINLS